MSLAPSPMSQVQVIQRNHVVRPAAGPEQGMAIHFTLSALRRWWKLAAGAALLLSALGGLTVYWLFQPVYEAAAWLQVEDRRPYLAFESRDEDRSKLFFQTQTELIRSPLVLGPAIKSIAQLPEIACRTDKTGWLAKQIKIAAVGESELFRIMYTGPDPKGAAAVVNAVTTEYFNLRGHNEDLRNQRIPRPIEPGAGQAVEGGPGAEEQSPEQSPQSGRGFGRHGPRRELGPAETPKKRRLADLTKRRIDAEVEDTMLDVKN